MAKNATITPPAPGALTVSSLNQAKKHKRSFDAVLTIEDPKAKFGDQLRFTNAPHPHLVMTFEDADLESYGYATATADDVSKALAFAREHAQGSLLVHCYHGIGRSAAIAIAILADRNGPGSEAAAVAAILGQRPHMTPNLVVIAHADALLGLDGALIAAIDASEAADPAKAKARAARHTFAIGNPGLYARKGWNAAKA